MLFLHRALSGQEIELFAIVWLKRGIVVETETSVLRSAAEAVTAASPCLTFGKGGCALSD